MMDMQEIKCPNCGSTNLERESSTELRCLDCWDIIDLMPDPADFED